MPTTPPPERPRPAPEPRASRFGLPTEDALRESRSFGVRAIPMLRPISWLARGWGDLWRCPVPSLLQGLLLALAGALIVAVAHDHFWLLAGAFSGFLLVAPILAGGFYACSRALEQHRPATVATALRAWQPTRGRLVAFGLLLAVSGGGWMLCSAALITGFAAGPIDTPEDFLRHVVLAERGWLFETWLALGALLAAPVFASSVVAVPLLMDRPVSLLAAVFTSWRVVMTHPAPLAMWALLILVMTLIGMATAMLGLIVVLPWLGHASWHAYRDLVRPVASER
ncbi:DUF2189 domain-containing protein [Roseateles amylovorans]|uniref:DUF2189 domain-containing protein n=1 Tax=Roseateles amylovorans TaxID=2978473 RepID=A0ABY6AVY9_9BURK|nr:DUF2189 domain-containing protein [Roseateles amylovorans]UXH76483.1 DUF2189 domain-containing protein [Roseateles amylovorans]